MPQHCSSVLYAANNLCCLPGSWHTQWPRVGRGGQGSAVTVPRFILALWGLYARTHHGDTNHILDTCSIKRLSIHAPHRKNFKWILMWPFIVRQCLAWSSLEAYPEVRGGFIGKCCHENWLRSGEVRQAPEGSRARTHYQTQFHGGWLLSSPRELWNSDGHTSELSQSGVRVLEDSFPWTSLWVAKGWLWRVRFPGVTSASRENQFLQPVSHQRDTGAVCRERKCAGGHRHRTSPGSGDLGGYRLNTALGALPLPWCLIPTSGLGSRSFQNGIH